MQEAIFHLFTTSIPFTNMTTNAQVISLERKLTNRPITTPLSTPELRGLLTAILTTTSVEYKLAYFEKANLTLVSNVMDDNHSAVHLLYQACQLLQTAHTHEKYQSLVELIHNRSTTLDKSIMVEIMDQFHMTMSRPKD